MRYEDVIAKFRAFGRGTVEERDYFGVRDRSPYRHGTITVRAASLEEAPDLAKALMALALETGTHLSGWSHYHPPQLKLSVSRDLTDEEIDEVPPHSRPVPTSAPADGGAA